MIEQLEALSRSPWPTREVLRPREGVERGSTASRSRHARRPY